jgi:alkylation response protein AidB-like acyl-CoA dehydrogenase
MDFDLTSDQKLLVDSVASFAKKESPLTRFRKLREDVDGLGWQREVLAHMGELGWLAIPFGEDVGGLGGRCIDVALVLEQLAMTLVPEPIVSSAILGGLAIANAGSAEQRGRWLPDVIAGTKTIALACNERNMRWDARRTEARAEKGAKGWKLAGEKRWVLDGHAADAFVVSANTNEGLALFVVDRAAHGLKIDRHATIDGHRAAMLTLEGVEVGDDRRLSSRPSLEVLDLVFDWGAACACAEGLGIMTTVLSMTRDYISQREQFGVKIGTFQALQHRCVDMFVETELAKSTTVLAALSIDEPDVVQRKRGVSAAKVQLCVGGRFAVQQAIQLHGGIGITDEADVGLYFKRMHALMALFGDEEHHVHRFASLPTFAV